MEIIKTAQQVQAELAAEAEREAKRAQLRAEELKAKAAADAEAAELMAAFVEASTDHAPHDA